MNHNESFYKLAFKNSIFVIKISGKVLNNHEALQNVTENIKALQNYGVKIVIICGFGVQLDEMSEKIYNRKPEKINGRRVTLDGDIECAKMCCGKIIADISGMLNLQSASFVSHFPINNSIIGIEKRSVGNFGMVGNIFVVHGNKIREILNNEGILLCASLGINHQNGEILNINADTTASKIAVAIGADKIIFISDVPFVMNRDGGKISVIKYSEIEPLMNSGAIKDGMFVKMENIKESIFGGVSKIHIISGLEQNSLVNEIFSKDGIGTVIESDEKMYNY